MKAISHFSRLRLGSIQRIRLGRLGSIQTASDRMGAIWINSDGFGLVRTILIDSHEVICLRQKNFDANSVHEKTKKTALSRKFLHKHESIDSCQKRQEELEVPKSCT